MWGHCRNSNSVNPQSVSCLPEDQFVLMQNASCNCPLRVLRLSLVHLFCPGLPYAQGTVLGGHGCSAAGRSQPVLSRDGSPRAKPPHLGQPAGVQRQSKRATSETLGVCIEFLAVFSCLSSTMELKAACAAPTGGLPSQRQPDPHLLHKAPPSCALRPLPVPEASNPAGLSLA